MTTAGLEARLGVRRPAFDLDAAIDVPAGGVLAVVGPNGAGKTTALRALAGLVRLADGQIVLAGRRLAGPGHHVPARGRDIGFLFQDYRLFPRMTALQNVAFALRSRGLPRAEAQLRAREWLERVGLSAYAAARPPTLSGGQAQRVALARALAPEPSLLLLDEPFAALDAEARLALREDLASHLGGYAGVTVLVTHDPNDALALADRMLVLEHGRVTDAGRTDEVVTRPRSAFVARLVGTNLLDGAADGASARFGALIAPTGLSGPVRGVVAPRDIRLVAGDTHRVASVVPQPGARRVRLVGDPDLVVEVAGATAVLEIGMLVGVEAAPTALDVTPAPPTEETA